MRTLCGVIFVVVVLAAAFVAIFDPYTMIPRANSPIQVLILSIILVVALAVFFKLGDAERYDKA